MVSLIEKTPCDGLLPVSEAGVTLSEVTPTRITSVSPFKGKSRATATALKTIGLGWPPAGSSISNNAHACVWTGRGQAFLIGTSPDGLETAAALTDQTDAWARMRLEGPKSEAVLARLVPLDLRDDAFGVGTVARSGLGHVMMILRRVEAEVFEVLVFRSMAATAVHELHQAMKAVAARAGIH